MFHADHLARLPSRHCVSPLQGFIPISTGAQILFDPAGTVVSHGDQAALQEAERLGTREKVAALLRTA